MKKLNFIIVGAIVACVICRLALIPISRKWRKDMTRFYKDGFRIGRVVGRDDILLNLKRADCFKQTVNELMSPEKETFPSDDMMWIEQAKQDLMRLKGLKK